MLEKVPCQVFSLILDAFLFHIPLVDSQAAD